MKTQRKSKNSSTRVRARKLTLGELIAATYNACGPQGAPKLLKLAIESQMVRFAPRPLF
jgi:hypothetical protein